MADKTENGPPADLVVVGAESSAPEKPDRPWLFKKGAPSANPGGRPKGIRERIREMTNDGEDLLKVFADFATGKIKGTGRDRIDAAKYLADRLYGRAPETVLTGQLSEEATAEALGLTPEQLTEIAKLAKTGS